MSAATGGHRCVETEDQTVAAGHRIDSARRQEMFEVLTGRIAGRFARVEPRRRARELVLGLLSDLPRKNCWTLAEYAGDMTPDGLVPLTCNEIQHLFTTLTTQPIHPADPRSHTPAPPVRMATTSPGSGPGLSPPAASRSTAMNITIYGWSTSHVLAPLRRGKGLKGMVLQSPRRLWKETADPGRSPKARPTPGRRKTW